MVTNIFSNFPVPNILEKKNMKQNVILQFFEMPAFETE